MESEWPRMTATSCGLSLRGGSGRRALSPIRAGRSDAKATSRSLLRAMARIVPAIARFSGSLGASLRSPGLRLGMDITCRGLLHRIELERALQDVLPVVGTALRELPDRKMGLVGGPIARVLVGLIAGLVQPRLEP